MKTRIPNAKSLALQWVHEAGPRHAGLGGFQEQCTRGHGPSPTSGQSPDLRGSEEDLGAPHRCRSGAIQIDLLLQPTATARREAPGLSSCPAHALDFVYPEGPAAARLHDIFFIASCRGGSGTKPASAGTPRNHDIPIFLIAISFTQTAQTTHLRKSSWVVLAVASGPGYTSVSH